MTEPTDAELDAVLCKHWPAFSMQAVLVRMWLRDAMRAALAKWGTPQPAPAPLSDAQIKELIEDGVFLGNCKEIVRAIEQAHGITQKGGSNAE